MKRFKRARARLQRGMTLIEIMIVVAIIGMLMGGVGIVAIKQLDKAKVMDTKKAIKTIEQALIHFQTDSNDACPKALNDLHTAKYLSKDPVDAWERERDRRIEAAQGNRNHHVAR